MQIENAVANAPRPIHEIAHEIRRDWGVKVNYAAKPYLDAMTRLSTMGARLCF